MDTMERETGIAYQDPVQAFESAIKSGRLSDDPEATNFAGKFMYMGTQTASFKPPRQQKDLFKNIDTRKYLP